MPDNNFDIPGFTFSSQDFPRQFAHGLVFKSDSSNFGTILKHDQSKCLSISINPPII